MTDLWECPNCSRQNRGGTTCLLCRVRRPREEAGAGLVGWLEGLRSLRERYGEDVPLPGIIGGQETIAAMSRAEVDQLLREHEEDLREHLEEQGLDLQNRPPDWCRLEPPPEEAPQG